MPARPDAHLTDLRQCPVHRESARAIFAGLGAQAARLGITLRNPPPEPSTCCGRGCNGCVWEGYLDAVAFWREDALAAIAVRDGVALTPLTTTPLSSHCAP